MREAVMNGEFYVGYTAKAPPMLARRIRGITLALVLGAVAIAVALVYAQAPFAASKFEFGEIREYEGVIATRPYPILFTRDAQFLLVAPGKHGLSSDGIDGQRVRLKGSLIERGSEAMLQVEPASLKSLSEVRASSPSVQLGHVVLTGEIVDSKCYLGVMNPGNGKVHRDCAARCISGGIPPAFVARDASGVARTFLLAGIDRKETLGYVAEPVEISGRVEQIGTQFVLNAEGIKRGSRRIP